MATLYYLNQYFTTTLSKAGGMNISETTGIVAQSVTGLDCTKAGVACIDWADPLVTTTAEWFTYTSINSTTKEFQGVGRGAEGFSAKAHDNGAVIAFPLSESHINNIAAVLAEVTGDGIAVGKTTTQTLTNKRITKRVTTITSSATPTINTDNCDVVSITALAAAITSMTTNLSGTPTNFQTLIFRILDDGTGRAITWGAKFEARGTALPTTTTANKLLTVGFIYDTVDSIWGCVASQNEA